MLRESVLLAQAGKQGGAGGGMILMVGYVVLFFAVYYFIAIRPQQVKQKAHQEKLNKLKSGDKVKTIGGIHGTLKKVGDKELEVEIAEGISITIDRNAVSTN